MGRKQRQKKKDQAQHQDSSCTNPNASQSQSSNNIEAHHKLRRFVHFMNGEGLDETSQALFRELNTETSLERKTSIVRELLVRSGTQVERNDQHCMDDGDQSIPSTIGQRQILRTLASQGFDCWMMWTNLLPESQRMIQSYKAKRPTQVRSMIWDLLPPLVQLVLRGHPEDVFNKLREVAYHASTGNELQGSPPLTLPALLETRYSHLRLSLLMLHMASQMFLDPMSQSMNHMIVATILLRFGARPDAKDLTGKTIIHYAAGPMATPATLCIASYCIAASRVSAYFGKRVVVDGMDEEDNLNQTFAIVQGYDIGTGCCMVQTNETKDGSRQTLLIDPCNLFQSLGGPCIEDRNRKLVDEQDRNGMTALHHILLSSRRHDVFKFLVEEQGCSIDLKDANGFCARDMLFHSIPDLPRSPFLEEFILLKIEKCRQKAQLNRCAFCQKRQKDDSNSKLRFSHCSRCTMVVYCSEECQRKDWKSHKPMCKEYSVAIKLERPIDEAEKDLPSFTDRSGNVVPMNFTWLHLPKGTAVGERFWVKVQLFDDRNEMMVYDKTRRCTFSIFSGSPGFDEIASIVRAEKVTKGIKSYFKARFDWFGDFFLYPNTSSLKTW